MSQLGTTTVSTALDQFHRKLATTDRSVRPTGPTVRQVCLGAPCIRAPAPRPIPGTAGRRLSQKSDQDVERSASDSALAGRGREGEGHADVPQSSSASRERRSCTMYGRCDVLVLAVIRRV